MFNIAWYLTDAIYSRLLIAASIKRMKEKCQDRVLRLVGAA